jgi:putative addiction module antidote
VRRKIAKVGNSWGLILSREILHLLGVEAGGEVEVEVAGNTLVVTAPDVDRSEVEASLAYLASRRERAEVYRRLAK